MLSSTVTAARVKTDIGVLPEILIDDATGQRRDVARALTATGRTGIEIGSNGELRLQFSQPSNRVLNAAEVNGTA